ncbi:MAG: acetyl-CoA hydrolase/transferase C-terminal domain-containing protein, partial [Pseudomonadota bacterium]
VDCDARGAVPRPVGFADDADRNSWRDRPNPLVDLQIAAPLKMDALVVRLGVAVDFLEASMSSADIRIALINPLAPRLPNAPKLSISQFTHVLRASFPLLSARSEVADARSEKIAETVARYIGDGATIQTGIGKIPGQIFRKITDRKNLRLHSGILSQDIRLLAEAGALAADNPATSPSAIGDEAFYGWLNGNPVLELAPVAHTHARETLARLEKFVTINSAIEVDLLGRVNAEWIGPRRVSAPGGLPNFSRAAAECSDGVSIVALPSTDRSGAVSRIRPHLQDGIEPTVDWRDVDVVVTEHGAADLRGLDAAGRAAALITVAAPDHRRVLSDSLDVAVR